MCLNHKNDHTLFIRVFTQKLRNIYSFKNQRISTETNPIQYIELITPLTHLSGQSPAENMASIGPMPPSGEVQNTLATVAKAAEERATEGKILFTPVATYLDQYSRSETLAELPQHQRRAIENFCHDLKRVATRHFDAYIRGSPQPPPPYSRPSETAPSSLLPPTPPISTPPTRASTPSNTPTNNEKASYARALKQPAQRKPALAVCPTQDAGQALEDLIPKIASWFGENIAIEKAMEWQTIRVKQPSNSFNV